MARKRGGKRSAGPGSKFTYGRFKAFGPHAVETCRPDVRDSACDSEVIAGKEITVRDARLMLSSGGGELTIRELVLEVLWVVALFASLAWAIAVGKATLWHPLDPMAGEFLACRGFDLDRCRGVFR